MAGRHADVVDAREAFADVLVAMMDEMGIVPSERCPMSLVKEVMAECTAEFEPSWRELMMWVMSDDRSESTRELLRASLRVSPMF